MSDVLALRWLLGWALLTCCAVLDMVWQDYFASEMFFCPSMLWPSSRALRSWSVGRSLCSAARCSRAAVYEPSRR